MSSATLRVDLFDECQCAYWAVLCCVFSSILSLNLNCCSAVLLWGVRLVRETGISRVCDVSAVTWLGGCPLSLVPGQLLSLVGTVGFPNGIGVDVILCRFLRLLWVVMMIRFLRLLWVVMMIRFLPVWILCLFWMLLRGCRL